MKKIMILTFLAGMLLLTGCVSVTLGGGGGVNALRGTGSMTTREFNVANFTGINIEGEFHVVYRQSATHNVRVHMHENLFEILQVNTNNDVLQVSTTRPTRTNRGYTPRVYIYAPILETVNLSGAINAAEWDTVLGSRFDVTVAGAVSAEMSLEVETVEIHVAGAGDFTLSGSAESANITLTGAGNVEAEDLQTKNAQVIISGAGNVVIAASDTLSVTISGAGRVYYVGNPQVSRTIAGFGSVQQR